MRTLATKQPTNESAKQNKNEEKGRSRSISPLSTGMPLLQRQCPCGGGCPRCGASNQLMRQVRGSTRVHIPPTPRSTQTPDFLRVFRWPQFRNTGRSVCEAGVELGVSPGDQLLNGMELVFTEQDAAAERRRTLARGGYSQYRVRQTLEEQAWQFVNGQWYQWTRVPVGTIDDPHPDLVCWNPPEIRTFDTPGWSGYEMVRPSTRQLRIDSQISDINATVIWLQQNFYTWVEGERVFTGDWDVVSVRYPWHNSLRLERVNPTANWIPVTPFTRIQPGHMEFGSNPRTESQ